MRRTLASILGLFAVASLLAAWLVAVPLVSAGNPCFHGFDIPDASTSTSNEVSLEPCAFTPTVTNVAVGSLVTFKNGPEFSHLVTGADQTWGSREVEIQPNRSVAYRFDKAGVFPYACALHPGMSGVIVVGDVATTAAAPASNDTTPPSAPAPTSSVDGLALAVVAVLAAIAGGVAGAAAVFLALRPRRQDPASLAGAN